MPVFKNRVVLEVARGIKAFLKLEVGLTRGEVPDERAALRKELARQSAGGLSGGKPDLFFVVGQKKSGTTWLMRTLDSHPELLCKGEGRFFGREWRRDKLKETKKQQQPTSLYNALANAEDLRFWIERSPWSRDDDPEEHLDNLTRMAVEYFLTQELAGTGKRMVGDKSPLLTPEDVKEIGTLHPGAKVVHIIRDGRDAVVSAAHHMWNFSEDREGVVTLQEGVRQRREAYRQDRQTLAESGGSVFTPPQLRGLSRDWAGNVRAAREHGRSLLGENYLEVRYEDLLVSPEKEIRNILGFLGALSDERTVAGCVGSSSFERLSKGRQPGEEDPSSFFRKGIAGDWRNVFTEKDKRVFKKEAGDLLVELGYEQNGRW
ncbi:MAG: sulfotransferase [Rubrobacter sp.]|nr:sulfotransferase [Rubrobacter sp.]